MKRRMGKIITFILSITILIIGVFAQGKVGFECVSIKQCQLGLVCASGNPRGRCVVPEGIIGISHFFVNLVQEDYSNSLVKHSQGGPLRTSRALAIIYLAAHDAYAVVAGTFRPKLRRSLLDDKYDDDGVEDLSKKEREKQAMYAAQVAALAAAKLVYPGSIMRINAVEKKVAKNAVQSVVNLGQYIGQIWFRIREKDGSTAKDFDRTFAHGRLLHHQPDPNYPIVEGHPGVEMNYGRTWRRVRPFVIRNVFRQAFLKPFPRIDSLEYRRAFSQVRTLGQCNNFTNFDGIPIRDVGTFWGYDSAEGIGVPPRLYLQVVLAVKQLAKLPPGNQLRALAAVSVSMADAGIVAWFWKFSYDLWRPIVGIRNDPTSPSPNWSPIGIAMNDLRNSVAQKPPQCVGRNPSFPSYPSGHAAFGTAAFKTLARMLSKRPNDISVAFTSDEFNGRTIDSVTGKVRRVLTQRMSLEKAIQQNKISRVYLGVHWEFDSEGGDIIGTKVADIVANEFKF